MTVLLAIAKSFLYGVALQRIVLRVSDERASFHAFLVELVWLSFTAMFSFAIDFFVLYEADPASRAILSDFVALRDSLLSPRRSAR